MGLLDVNVPRGLIAWLELQGIEARHASDQGWAQLSDPELVIVAARDGFTCILTRDRRFAESAARGLRQATQMCLVVLNLPQLKQSAFLAAFAASWDHSRPQVQSGAVLLWP